MASVVRSVAASAVMAVMVSSVGSQTIASAGASDGPGTYYVPPIGTANRVADAEVRTNAVVRRTIAFLGGSITEMNGFRPRVMALLRAKHPQVDFREIAAGLSSTCSDVAAYRLAEDVLAKGLPDLLVVDAAVNDDQDGHFTREHCIRGMEGVLRQARQANPAMNLVVALFVNHDQFKTLRAGGTPLPYAAHRVVAERYGAAVADVGSALARAAKDGVFTWEEYRDCHPSPEGCDFAAKVVMEAVDAVFDPLAKPMARPLPKPLDAFSYGRAAYVPFDRVVRDVGWNVSVPDWKAVPGAKRGYFATGPALWSVTPGAVCELAFAGTSLAAVLTAGPDAGALEVSIDDGPWTRHPLYMPWSEGLNYPYARTLADGLRDAAHRARLRVATDVRTDKTFSAVRIHRLAVNGRPQPVIDYRTQFSDEVLNQAKAHDPARNLAPMLDVGVTVPNGGIFRFFPFETWQGANVPRFAKVFAESPYQVRSGLCYDRIDWSRLEGAEGEYLFDSVVEPLLLRCVKEHERFFVGLACNTGSGSVKQRHEGRALSVPKYLFDRMAAEGHPMRADDSFGPGWTPDYDSPVFLARHRALLLAFAKWLEGNVSGATVKRKDLIYAVEMRYLGYWGEGGIPPKFYPRTDALDRFADAYVEAFPDIPLVAGAHETLLLPHEAQYRTNPANPLWTTCMAHVGHLFRLRNATGPLGYFIDSWHPYNSQFDVCSTRLYQDSDGRPAPLADAFSRGVYGSCYLTGEFGYLTHLDPSGMAPYAGLYQQFTSRHLSGISVHNFSVHLSAEKRKMRHEEIPAEVYANARRCLSMVGYRLVLGSPRVVRTEKGVEASFTLANIGVSRMFHAYNRIHLLAYAADGHLVEDRALPFDLRLLKPSSTPLLWKESEGQAFHETFPSDVVEVRVRIPDEKGIEHPLTLSNWGRRSDGSYRLNLN